MHIARGPGRSRCGQVTASKHLDHIKQIHKPQCHIQQNEIESARLPTKRGCDGRTDEEKHIHIQTAYYSNRTDGIYDCGDIGDVKFIWAVEIEKGFDFVHFMYLSFLH